MYLGLFGWWAAPAPGILKRVTCDTSGGSRSVGWACCGSAALEGGPAWEGEGDILTASRALSSNSFSSYYSPQTRQLPGEQPRTQCVSSSVRPMPPRMVLEEFPVKPASGMGLPPDSRRSSTKRITTACTSMTSWMTRSQRRRLRGGCRKSRTLKRCKQSTASRRTYGI